MNYKLQNILKTNNIFTHTQQCILIKLFELIFKKKTILSLTSTQRFSQPRKTGLERASTIDLRFP